VAVAAHDGRLLLVTVEPAQVIELAAPDNGPISGLAWSPDSAWLAWSQPGPGRLARIRMARITPGGDNIPTAPSDPRSAIIDVTDGRFADTEPAFTTDGLYLAFLSRRTFDPIYDAHSLDLSFPFGSRPYLVPLAAETMSPFGPWPGGRPVTHSESMKDDSERPGVTLDTEGIQSRVVAVPVDEGRYAGLAAVRGGLAWMRGTVSGVLAEGAQDRPRPALERFDLRKSESALLASEVDWYTVSGDGARLVIGDGSDVRVQPADRKADDDSSDDVIPVDLTRARYLADPAALWAHAFDEAGRIIRRDFWTPDMSGVDWDGVLDAYRPLLAAVRTSAEFADLLWEVFAELGTSHAYVHASWEFGVPESRGTAVGVLGADVVRSGDGHWLVERVLPGESSDPLARSPLAAPGVAVRAGEEIAEVDGRPVDPARGPWPLLVATAGKPVELALRQPETPQTRRVVIVPLHDDGRLRYQDWVAGRRRFVRQRSEGKAGYLHIPDMNAEGWAHLHRDLKIEMGREALIVDVRGNLGGNTSELIIEKLARRIIGWSHPRGLRAVSYPRDAPRGPVVALADEFAASDGDMVTAAIRIMRLGPVVGARTWGGVIGFDGWESLADGTCITVPGYAHWFGEYGWGVENHGVDPDVEVLITPDDWAVGRDTQLEAAVDMALAALASRPAPAMPDPATGPSKRRPLLPPRQR
jgi:tricorn protease